MSSVLLGEEHGISVIDFRHFLDGTAKQEVADAILDSFKRVGFVYLMNHGIPDEKVKSMFEWSRRFFALPMDKKQLAPHPPGGYSAPGREKISQHVYDELELKNIRTKAPDLKESFECGWEGNTEMPNIWLPQGVLPGFQEACMDFFRTCHETELQVCKALAVGLRIPENHLAASHTAQDNQLRLLHYPSVPADDNVQEKITRVDAHSDYGSITLLLQDDVEGLEIEDPQHPGEFRSAPSIKGALIVNAGDFLMRWSNDMIRSTVHRVRAPPQLKTRDGMLPSRYSIPYFCTPEFTRVVECLPGTYSEGNPPKYEPISAKAYVMQRLSATYEP